MFDLILFANLNQKPNMSCIQVKEVAGEVMSSDLSKRHKEKILRSLFGKHMRYDCFKS